MTISTTASRISYSGNGVTTAFSFPYFFKNQADLKVVLVAADGTETLQVLSSNYTIAGTVFNGAYNSGGTINMSVAPSNTQKLVIYRDPTITQELDLVENDSLPAESLEKALDQGIAISQRLGDRINRSARLAEGYTGSFDPILPGVTPANTALVVNADGDGFAFGPTTTDIADAASNAAAAAASAIAAAASETAAGLSEVAALASETAAGLSEAAAAASEAAAGSIATSTATAIANGSAAFIESVAVSSTPYTITAANIGKLHVVDASSGAVTITLPAIADVTTLNKSVSVKKSDASANTVTIQRASADTIEGATSLVLRNPGDAAVLVPVVSAADWERISPAVSSASAFKSAQELTDTGSPHTLTNIDINKLYSINAASGAVTVNLPSIATLTDANKSVFFNKSDSSANAVTLARNGSDTIEGGTSYTLDSEDEGAMLVADTVNDDWRVIPLGISIPPKLSTASGAAPSYSARAWVKFIATTPSIVGSANISSVNRTTTGTYTISFTADMPDANYAVVATWHTSTATAGGVSTDVDTETVGSFRYRTLVGTTVTTGSSYSTLIVIG